MSTDLNVKCERFWSELPTGADEAVWASDPSTNAAVPLPWFQPHFASDLPLLDVGCGNGTQTVFLAEHYSRVLGLEVSESAVQSAKQTYPGVEFRQYDLLDEEATKALHSELGDCNIYVRAVLHPLPDERRAIAVANLAFLLGKRGGLFVIELAKAAKDVFGAALAAGPDSVPKLRRVLSYGITPANLEDGMLEQLFENAGIEVVDHGSSLLLSTDRLADGEQLKAPLNYVVGRLKHS